MSRRITKLYMQSVASGAPALYRIPVPGRIFASDLGDTFVNGILAGAGTGLVSIGTSYLATGHVDTAACASWSAIVTGLVIGLPIAGDTIAEVAGDVAEAVSRGWTRGQSEPEADPEQEPVSAPEPTEDEAGAARVPGAWWYRTRGGQLRCYYTPANPKDRSPIISDMRMQAIFRLALNGIAFSEDAIRAQVKGLSQPRFRILQRDWRKKVLYILNEDNSGYLTKDGKIVAEAIVNTPLPQAH